MGRSTCVRVGSLITRDEPTDVKAPPRVAGVKAGDLFDANLDLGPGVSRPPLHDRHRQWSPRPGGVLLYIAQDATFLDTFVRAYALGLAKAPDQEAMTTFKALLDGGVEELGLHHAAMPHAGV